MNHFREREREIRKETFTTKTKTDTILPTWNESFQFGQTYDFSKPTTTVPTLKLTVYHHDTSLFSFGDSPLGIVEIPVSDIPEGNKNNAAVVDYSLQPLSTKSKASGHFKLKLCFNGSQAEITRDASEDEKTLENSEDESGENSGDWSMTMQA